MKKPKKNTAPLTLTLTKQQFMDAVKSALETTATIEDPALRAECAGRFLSGYFMIDRMPYVSIYGTVIG